jgi:hypothetical protein
MCTVVDRDRAGWEKVKHWNVQTIDDEQAFVGLRVEYAKGLPSPGSYFATDRLNGFRNANKSSGLHAPPDEDTQPARSEVPATTTPTGETLDVVNNRKEQQQQPEESSVIAVDTTATTTSAVVEVATTATAVATTTTTAAAASDHDKAVAKVGNELAGKGEALLSTAARVPVVDDTVPAAPATMLPDELAEKKKWRHRSSNNSNSSSDDNNDAAAASDHDKAVAMVGNEPAGKGEALLSTAARVPVVDDTVPAAPATMLPDEPAEKTTTPHRPIVIMTAAQPRKKRRPPKQLFHHHPS